MGGNRYTTTGGGVSSPIPDGRGFNAEKLIKFAANPVL